MNSTKIIVALDFPDAASALALVSRLDPALCRLKVGKELFTAAGPDLVRTLAGRGFEVFLDLKFHDIPNTVARAGEAAVKLGVDMFNVHASGGSKMIRETVEAVQAVAAKSGRAKPIVLAVTVLTSLNDNDLREIGFERNTNDLVLHLATMAQKAGADGVVASPQDIATLRTHLGDEFILVTPGIRSAQETAKDDQKRTLSAFDAVKLGVDYVVVGRPIRNAADPLAACRNIVQEIAAGMAAG